MSHNRHPIRHSRHFIPCDQEGALVWVQNFVAFARENREALGFEESRIEEAARALANYEKAYATAMNRDTRTMRAVVEKNDSRRVIEGICRSMGGMIRVNPKITDAQRMAAGLRPRPDGVRRPAQRPVSAPELVFVRAMDGQYTFRYYDLTTPHSRTKPEGVAFLGLYLSVGREPASDPEAARWCAYITRTPFTVGLSENDPSQVATFFGRWMSKRQENGPWSAPVRVPIVPDWAQAA